MEQKPAAVKSLRETQLFWLRAELQSYDIDG